MSVRVRREFGMTLSRSRLLDAAWGAASVAIATLLALFVLQIWNADLHVPFSYNGDANFNQMIVKGTLENGWYERNPDLAAPLGHELYDFPAVSGDNAQILLMKGIGLFSSDSALVMNLFFLFAFPLTALFAYIALRLLGVGRAGAGTAAILFPLLPYHFVRGEYHLFIGAYYAVPLGAFLGLSVLFGRPPVFAAPPGETSRRRAARLVGVGAACVLVASAHVYYATFAIILLLGAALLRGVTARSQSAVKAGCVLAAAIALGGVLNHLPNASYRAAHGANPALERSAVESETYGAKLAAMVLPAVGHRLEPLAKLRERYREETATQAHEGDAQALGIVASAGLVALLVALLFGVVREGPLVRETRLLPIAAAAGLLFGVGTVGGLSSISAFVATSQLRSWARISVLLAFLALTAVALLVDHVEARRGRRAAVLVAVALVAIGFLDQTNAGQTPAYAELGREYRSDAALVKHIEATLPPGSAVFQLPVEPFPEPVPDTIPKAMGPYDMARGYIHSNGLRWSYGGMKGRDHDWQARLARLPPAQVMQAIVALGFRGLYIDRHGYSDGAHRLEQAVAAEVGSAPGAISPNRRLAFFDLRAYAARLAARTGRERFAAVAKNVLSPVAAEPEAGFSQLQQRDGHREWLGQSRARILLGSAAELVPRTARLVMTLAAPTPKPVRVALRFPGGSVERFVAPASGAVVNRTITLSPGVTYVDIRVKGRPQIELPGPGAYSVRLLDPVLVDQSFAAFGPLPRDRRAAAFLSPFGLH